MKVITAPQEYEWTETNILCFLAGGITNCPDWQQEVIDFLEFANPSDLVLFNPRRADFPINDPSATEEQIKWEFKYLNKADIFSMYFCAGESDQPICMYELGRHLERMMNEKDPIEIPNRVLVSIEDGYKRKNDVVIQTKLALGTQSSFINTDAHPLQHAEDILINYVCLKHEGTRRFKEKLLEYKNIMREYRRK